MLKVHLFNSANQDSLVPPQSSVTAFMWSDICMHSMVIPFCTTITNLSNVLVEFGNKCS